MFVHPRTSSSCAMYISYNFNIKIKYILWSLIFFRCNVSFISLFVQHFFCNLSSKVLRAQVKSIKSQYIFGYHIVLDM